MQLLFVPDCAASSVTAGREAPFTCCESHCLLHGYFWKNRNVGSLPSVSQPQAVFQSYQRDLGHSTQGSTASPGVAGARSANCSSRWLSVSIVLHAPPFPSPALRAGSDRGPRTVTRPESGKASRLRLACGGCFSAHSRHAMCKKHSGAGAPS